MEDDPIAEKLESLLIQAKNVEVLTDANFSVLDNVMRQYWLIVKRLNEIAPQTFNNIANNGIIDLINRSNLAEATTDFIEKSEHYKNYWDYLIHSINITIDCVKNRLPEKSLSDN